MYSTPVLILLFNRPEATSQVFAAVRRQRPKRLFIAADGPRTGNTEDLKNCTAVRNIISAIDWDCEVKTLFQQENLGCGRAAAAGICWFFEHVEQGVILEDDCLPNDSFFSFCENLLERYREQPNVMMVCGTSYQPLSLNRHSYYFSRYPHVWGWATWKRAWAHYDFSLSEENRETRSRVLKQIFANEREVVFWQNNLTMIDSGLDTWDYQWMYRIWKNNGLCITPWRNMISNIGFGAGATHTTDKNSDQSRMAQHEMDLVIHPDKVALNHKADRFERFTILIEPASTYYFKKIRHFAGRYLKKIGVK